MNTQLAYDAADSTMDFTEEIKSKIKAESALLAPEESPSIDTEISSPLFTRVLALRIERV